MPLSKYTKPGNEFFERRLRNFRNLGITYPEFWQRAYNEYIHKQSGQTDQGILHTKDVEHNIWVLIEKYASLFSNEALYILSMASALHDCAKGSSSDSDHALRGADIIRKDLFDKGWVSYKATSDAIASIVSVHQSGDFTIFTNDTIELSGRLVRIKECAAIFRLADMMSTTEARSIRLLSGVETSFINTVRSNIRSCRPSPKDDRTLEIIADIDSFETKRDIDSYIDGLNKEITQAHKDIIINAKAVYTTNKYAIKETYIKLPYRFALSNLSFLDYLRSMEPIPISIIGKNNSRFVPCYFLNSETDTEIHSQLIKCVYDNKDIEAKYLYWTLKGTKAYLTVCKGSKYQLSAIAHRSLAANFPNLYSIINSDQNLWHIIDLGVGDGQEINIILKSFLTDLKIPSTTKIKCTLIDYSYHMLRVAVNTLDGANHTNAKYMENILLSAINCDFQDIQHCKNLLNTINGSRLFCLLGGTLGNFPEKAFIELIQNEMTERDFMLIDADLIGNRRDEEILSSYDDRDDKKFIFNPLSDIGLEFDEAIVTFEMKSDISEVTKAKTVVARCRVEGSNVQMGRSTKYDIETLKSFLITQFQFQLMECIVDNEHCYALILLKKKKK